MTLWSNTTGSVPGLARAQELQPDQGDVLAGHVQLPGEAQDLGSMDFRLQSPVTVFQSLRAWCSRSTCGPGSHSMRFMRNRVRSRWLSKVFPL